MQNYKLLHDHPDHFLLTNGKAHFKIAKSGIDQPTADKIRSFADGGTIQTPYEAGVEAKEKNIRATPTQSPDEAQTEAAEKNRRAQPPKDYSQENNPELKDKENPLELAEGGKLSASDRKHIAPKNFAGPDRSYPIEDASHARNALARVSQHGSPELQAQVRAKVHSKYPGIEQSHAEGGEVAPGLWNSIKQSFGSPDDSTPSKPEAPAEDHSAEYEKIRQTNSENMKTGNYAGGGPVASNSVKDISHETQSQAIGRYAAGNPATLAKGGQIPTVNTQDQGGEFPWHRNGKYHFHFYDGAPVTTPLDKQEGAGPQQASPLDKYVGGEPAQGTPLDNYADGGDVQPSDSEKLAQASQEVQQNTDAQNSTIANASADQANTPEMPSTAAPVPQAQQISAVPKPLPPTPDQQPQMLSDFDKQLALEKQGIQEGANAQSQGYQQTAKAIGENVLQQKQQMDAYKLHADQITAQNEQLFNAVASSKVDPNHFWNNKSTGGKIAAAIGVILGGAASGMAGGSGQNQGLMKLNSQIQEDIDAQKNDQSNKMNLYKMGLEKYRDAQSAQQFATLQSNALLQGTLAKIAANTGNAQAQATAHQMIGQIGVQNAGLRSELAMKAAAMNAMNQPQQPGGGVNSDKLRLLVQSGVIPKEEVPAAMKEYGDYQKLGTILDDTDKTFDIGRKNANWRQAILPHWTPDITQASKQYDAAVDGFLGKITKETEGRVTPADVELMRPSMPSMTDSPETAAQKLNTIKDQIREKYSFPTLTTNRILHPNDPRITSSATRQKRFTESKPK